jgi:hypothetical protein
MRRILCLVFVLVVAGCGPAEEKEKEDIVAVRKIRTVTILNGTYTADPGIRLFDEPLPETEKEFVEKFGKTDEMLFVKGVDKFYGYRNGRLQELDAMRK